MNTKTAKEFLEELMANDELRAEFAKDPEAFLKNGGYGFTEDELKEICMMNRELDEDELNSISGGKCLPMGMSYYGGGCTLSYYKEQCGATVEKGSWCWSNDYCYWDENEYTCISSNK